MELLEGQSLAERLAGGRPLPLAEAAPLFMGVLRGVAAAHAAGIVHRDLKPENVFLCRPRDGSADIPKVLDFGISKLSKRENVSTITEDGSLLGTLQYMSPEQLRGQDTDERTDVYALGVILYRMLTAQMPFPGANHIDLVLNMASHPARLLGQFLAGVPEGLERAVARALEREAGSRFESVEAFASAPRAVLRRPGVPHRRSAERLLAARSAVAPLRATYARARVRGRRAGDALRCRRSTGERARATRAQRNPGVASTADAADRDRHLDRGSRHVRLPALARSPREPGSPARATETTRSSATACGSKTRQEGVQSAPQRRAQDRQQGGRNALGSPAGGRWRGRTARTRSATAHGHASAPAAACAPGRGAARAGADRSAAAQRAKGASLSRRQARPERVLSG